MSLHVAPDAVAEGVRPEVRLQHAQDRLALVVGDRGIEGVGRLQLVGHVLLDRLGVGLRVGAHRAFLGAVFLFPPLPARVAQRGLFCRHPRGKAFVQPEIIPPAHGHEVAVPLMRHFVGLRGIDLLFLGQGAGGWQHQQLLHVRDRTPVFHGAREAAGNRDRVELGERKGVSKVVVVVREDLRGIGERVAAVFLLTAHRPHAKFRGAARAADMAEIPADERDQIGRHLRRGLEAHGLERTVNGALGNRHVRQRRPAARHRDGQLEHRAECRLVPTREHASRIRGFHLGREHLPAGATRIGVRLQEQPLRPRFDLAAVIEAQPM